MRSLKLISAVVGGDEVVVDEAEAVKGRMFAAVMYDGERHNDVSLEDACCGANAEA